MWAVRLGYSHHGLDKGRDQGLCQLLCVPNAQAKASMRLSTAWVPRSSYSVRQRGKTCTEWGGCHDMVAMCMQAARWERRWHTDGTARRKANHTLPCERLKPLFTGQERGT